MDTQAKKWLLVWEAGASRPKPSERRWAIPAASKDLTSGRRKMFLRGACLLVLHAVPKKTPEIDHERPTGEASSAGKHGY
jgi:hypothetical protein